jgi:hypothetical protein
MNAHSDIQAFDHVETIMETSSDLNEIAKALPKAQAAMGEVFKKANNPAFKSKYADLSAVVEAVLPALNEHGISLLQPTAYDGHAVKVGTMLLHESGQWVRCTLTIPLAKKDAHGIGSACTYGRRYGLQAMSGVAPEDDDGNAASAKRDATVTAPQVEHLRKLLDDSSADVAAFLGAYKAPSVEKFPADAYDNAVRALQAKIERATQKEPA